MNTKKNVLGIIPARGNSKRLKKKNIRILLGKPLLGWTIEAAQQSGIFTKLFLTTDDKTIADVGQFYRVEDNVIRPASLSQDDTPMNEVIRWVLEICRKKGENYDYLALLQPTSPLRTSHHIVEAFQLLNEKEEAGVISVCKTDHPLEWMGKLPETGSLDQFIQETELDKQSQAFSPSYQINGAIYIVPVDRFLDEGSLFLSNGMMAYIMDRKDSVDIDDEYDLVLAEWLLRHREEN